MALFFAKMRHINMGHGITGAQPCDLVCLHPLQPLAQAQDGQGAEQPDGINIQIIFHCRHGLSRAASPVHKNVSNS